MSAVPQEQSPQFSDRRIPLQREKGIILSTFTAMTAFGIMWLTDHQEIAVGSSAIAGISTTMLIAGQNLSAISERLTQEGKNEAGVFVEFLARVSSTASLALPTICLLNYLTHGDTLKMLVGSAVGIIGSWKASKLALRIPISESENDAIKSRIKSEVENALKKRYFSDSNTQLEYLDEVEAHIYPNDPRLETPEERRLIMSIWSEIGQETIAQAKKYCPSDQIQIYLFARQTYFAAIKRYDGLINGKKSEQLKNKAEVFRKDDVDAMSRVFEELLELPLDDNTTKNT